MPDTAPATAADIEAIADRIERSLVSPLSELAAALTPATNTRQAPSDEIHFIGTQALEAPTQLLVPAQETRVKVSIITAAAGVYLCSQPGQVAGAGNTFPLTAGILYELATRAAIYCASSSGAVDLSLYVEFARYTR